MPSPRGRTWPIPAWRKALYAVIMLGLFLGAAEGAVRLYLRGQPPPPPAYPSLEAYLADVRGKASRPLFLDGEGDLPGVNGPRVVIRLPETTPASPVVERVSEGHFTMQPRDLPMARTTLFVLGDSSAHGSKVRHAESFATLVEADLRRSMGEPDLRVLNLARPAWELNSVAALLERLIREVRPLPRAVILLVGNNEFLTPPLHGLRPGPLRSLGLYQALHLLARRLDWLRPPPGWDFHQYEHPHWNEIPTDYMKSRIWRPGDGIENASHQRVIRDIFRENFARTLRKVADLLGSKGVHLVLVPPPLNLHLFPAGVRPQPVSFRDLASDEYEALALRLEQAMTGPDPEALRALIRDEPSGPIQHFVLGQWLEAKGQRREALAALTLARDAMIGVLGSVPSFHRAMWALKGPSVSVVETRDLYPEDKPIRVRARELFVDACHPTPLGHRLLADRIGTVLLSVLRGESAPISPRAPAPSSVPGPP